MKYLFWNAVGSCCIGLSIYWAVKGKAEWAGWAGGFGIYQIGWTITTLLVDTLILLRKKNR